ncbi:sensor histidine kinase [Streptococcus sp. 20-1249]|uniref:sensor histidine kinase n=1 Tax=Streptococcus hepaticus TaxID=3349163 RepID=UPI0037493C4E
MIRSDFWTFFSIWLRIRFVFLFGFTLMASLLWILAILHGVAQELAGYGLLLLLVVAFLLFLLDGTREFRKWTAVQTGQEFSIKSPVEFLLQEKYQEAEQKLLNFKAEERARQEELQDYYTMRAHQMKVPIAASQLLIGDLETSQHKQELTQELVKIEQYTGLVLNYLRLQSFHDDLVFCKENLADLVNQTVKKFSIFFIQQRIRLELGDLEQEIVTDKRWFGLLLEQFLSNALKYTKTGTISILLR